MASSPLSERETEYLPHLALLTLYVNVTRNLTPPPSDLAEGMSLPSSSLVRVSVCHLALPSTVACHANCSDKPSSSAN